MGLGLPVQASTADFAQEVAHARVTASVMAGTTEEDSAHVPQSTPDLPAKQQSYPPLLKKALSFL